MRQPFKKKVLTNYRFLALLFYTSIYINIFEDIYWNILLPSKRWISNTTPSRNLEKVK